MTVAVFAVGNPARGDDALGPLLFERLERNLPAHVSAVLDFQLQIEHALDLQGHDLALFIDAGSQTPAPFSFLPVQAERDASHSTHALTPAAVLEVYQRVVGAVPPPSYVLCVRGDAFELGAGLSTPAQTHLEAAWAFLKTLLAEPLPARWQNLAAAPV